MTFSEMNLAEPLLRAIALENYTSPSPIQKEAIPLLLAGKDMFGCAQTGTGKTAAFALPIVHKLHESNANGRKDRAPRALVLAPTRELATQVADSFKSFARFAGVRVAAIYGGVSQHPQAAALRNGVDVLVATPGRLVDLIQQKLCTLRNISILVLDEADHMLDLGFIDDVKNIVAKIPENRQTLLFSATMPKAIASLAASILKDPVNVAVAPSASPVVTIEQKVYHMDRSGKGRLLVDVLQKNATKASLVFTRTKHGADKVCNMLNAAGIGAKAIHGNKSQAARRDAMTAFKKGKLGVLVATDIAARGIDVHDLPLVVNYDFPDTPETYVHRIGRTGRAGKAGVAVSFCDVSERPMLRDIQKLIKTTIQVAENYSPKLPAERPVAKATPKQTAMAEPRRQTSDREFARKGYDKRADSRPHATENGFARKGNDKRTESMPYATERGFTRKGHDRRADSKPYATENGFARKGYDKRAESAPHATDNGFARKGYDKRKTFEKPSHPFAPKQPSRSQFAAGQPPRSRSASGQPSRFKPHHGKKHAAAAAR